MSLDDLYMEIILDHYRTPRNRAPELEPHDVHVHHSNPLCGDELDLRLRVDTSDGPPADRRGGLRRRRVLDLHGQRLGDDRGREGP
jgi:hypothetical protein